MNGARPQSTIRNCTAVQGFGYWSGLDVTVEFRPAPPHAGLTFVRKDLGAAARIPVRPEYRTEVPRRTNLCYDGVHVHMVEHVLAALAGLQIDNCEIWVDQTEMPGMDGSSLPFVEALLAAGAVPQSAAARQLVITEPIRVTDGSSSIAAHPSPEGEFTVEFELYYPHNHRIGRQSTMVAVTPETFARELAPCRTFLLASEADALVTQGLGVRVTTSHLLVFDDDGPIDNPLRFANECARHKALDVIGDLALTGCNIVGQFTAYRSSHRLNAVLAREILGRFAEPNLSYRAAS
ncbi:UDP-3-O-acyl-N-acetylglucosamine deacetylase [Pirellulales bacterium]|nr:UDP-3-O-acyl-N-acetylglucosamine deacetylase [Pirellulales bacterium]